MDKKGDRFLCLPLRVQSIVCKMDEYLGEGEVVSAEVVGNSIELTVRPAFPLKNLLNPIRPGVVQVYVEAHVAAREEIDESSNCEDR